MLHGGHILAGNGVFQRCPRDFSGSSRGRRVRAAASGGAPDAGPEAGKP
jgi:hypothetical protein